MKKIIFILIISLVAYSVIFWFFVAEKITPKTPNENQVENIEVEEDVLENESEEVVVLKECFGRKQIATEESPYTVQEFIELNIDGESVSGEKTGNQSGPDMTNGYEGSLSGKISDDKIEVIFSYSIEGSDQKEKEEYVLKTGELVKQRYPLIEDEDGVLVPDKTKEASLIAYKKVDCI